MSEREPVQVGSWWADRTGRVVCVLRIDDDSTPGARIEHETVQTALGTPPLRRSRTSTLRSAWHNRYTLNPEQPKGTR